MPASHEAVKSVTVIQPTAEFRQHNEYHVQAYNSQSIVKGES